MSNTIKYFFDEDFGEKENETEEKLSKEVEDILQMYSLLSLEDKVALKRKLRDLSLF